MKYNSASGENLSFNDDSEINSSLGKINELKDNVYKYYEYVQFKRARFDCSDVEYDDKTGRIISMTFVFTGKFE